MPVLQSRTQNDALTGSLGVVFRPLKTWLIRTNLGTAFRAPNVDDMGKIFDNEPQTVMLPNPNLQAEYAYNADFGTVFIIEKILKIEFSAYYTHLNNAMVRRNFSLGGSDSIIYKGELSQVQAIQNAAMARVYGLHSGLELKLSNRLLFTNDINFQQGFEEMDNGSVSPSRHAAPFFGISRLQYRLNTLIMETNIQYQGKREYEDLAIEERGKTEIYAKDENGLN